MFGVEIPLVKAIGEVETNWDPWKVRYEPKWYYFVMPSKYSQKLGISLETEWHLQSMSWGPMQIMGSVAREVGFDDMLTRLTIPENGLCCAIKKLSMFVRKHEDLSDVIASYNAGEPKHVTTPDSPYVNQEYVGKVMNAYLRYSVES